MNYSNSQQPQAPINSGTPPRRSPGRGKWLTLGVVLVLAGAGTLFWALRGTTIYSQSTTVATISITAQGFEPQTIKVKQGDSVAWENKDTQARQVDADPDPSSNTTTNHSGQLLAQGDSYTTTFETPGSYGYHDHTNPETFKATVIVE